MPNKNIKKLKRKQLLELMLIQQKRIDELEIELKLANEKLSVQQTQIDQISSLNEIQHRLTNSVDTIEHFVKLVSGKQNEK